MSKSLPKLAGMLFGATLAIGLGVDVQAAPMSYSRAPVGETISVGPIVKTVTAAGMTHRSARRTARRTSRRHAY
jgi:hypothetical protein